MWWIYKLPTPPTLHFTLCPSLLQAKLGVLDEDFAKWRFTFHSPRTGAAGEALTDDEELYARGVCGGGEGGKGRELEGGEGGEVMRWWGGVGGGRV